MKVGIELFKGKLLSDGRNPIAIRLTDKSKTKYKMIGISCIAKNWNNDKKKITCREVDYKIKNQIIKERFDETYYRAEWFLKNNIEIDFEYILSNKPLELYTNNDNTNLDYRNFIDIIKARIQSYDKIKTRENYQSFLKLMIKLYDDYININEVNQAFALRFRAKLDELGFSSNHKNGMIKCFTSSYKFGVENRWIVNPYTISLKKYPYQAENRDITNQDFTKIISLFKKHIQANFNMSRFESLALFCLDIAFQGLAPFDLAKIKIKDLELCTIKRIDEDYEQFNNDIDYRKYIAKKQQIRNVIKINTYRAKTNTIVPICCDYSTIRPVLYYLCKGKTKDDYLVNCYNSKKNYNEKQLHNRCGNYFMNQSIKLNSLINELSISNKVTFYIARHAFINCLDKKNISHDLIRKMVGHKSSTLEKSYINKPTDWEQADIIFQIFNDIETIENLELQAKGERVCIEQWKELELFLLNEIKEY